MAESSSQILQQEPNPQKQDPQEEQPESLIPFEPAIQVEFKLDEITFHDNNEVALTYKLKIPQKGILGEVGVNIFRNAIGAHYLSYSTKYVATPPLESVRALFFTIGYSREIRAKGTLKESCLPPRWRLLMAQSFNV
nr:hypothetical protein [Tanacetum cinerariifolium]